MPKIPFQTPAKPMLHVVESIQQDTPDCAVPLTPGAVRLIPASGQINRAKSDTPANARVYGIITHKTPGNCPATAIRRGVISGYDFSNVNYDAPVYLDNDGDLSTDAGTVPVVVGRVIFLKGNKPGTPYNKGLSVEL